MKRYRSSLPPLDTLIFFEAAARHNSFTRAAGELNVTQAAVSKRIRELESHLGCSLFHRDGRKLWLTEAGRTLLDKTGMALEFLDSACKSISDSSDETTRVAANNAISHFWLTPRLKSFGMDNPHYAVELRTTDSLSNLLDPTNDIAIVYGHGDVPGWDCRLLFPERLVPVASPAYLHSVGYEEGRPFDEIDEDVARRLTLLDYERVAPDWVNWPAWINQSGMTVLTGAALQRSVNYAQTIGLAVEGHGLALGNVDMLSAEITTGDLRPLNAHSHETGRGYYLSTNHKRNLNDAGRALVSALLNGG